MSIGQVTITYKAKKQVGSSLVDVLVNGGNTVTGTGATKSVAEAAIQTTLDNAISAAQGNVTDLQDASAAFNS